MVSCNLMQQLRDIANSRNLLWNLTLRELRSKYRRSILGWSWSMLNPLAQMAIYTFVFGVLFGAQAPVGDPSGITTFGLYLLTGLIPWGFFSLICGVGLQAILSNTTLVRKVAFARESLVISQVLFCSVQFSIEMTLVCVALTIAGSFVLPFLPVTVLLMIFLALFAMGIAFVLSVSAVFFRDLPYLWTIINQIWFLQHPSSTTHRSLTTKFQARCTLFCIGIQRQSSSEAFEQRRTTEHFQTQEISFFLVLHQLFL